ncbi:MAG: hypothetical protein Q8Q20_01565 [bacterium]|nr:hypothetical protein [bacterium]
MRATVRTVAFFTLCCLSITFVLSACKETTEPAGPDCSVITPQSDVYLEGGRFGIGGVDIKGMYQQDGIKLGEECENFTVLSYGGVGRTCDVVGTDRWVHLTWMGLSLLGITISEGWVGETDRGVALGDTYEDVERVYPEAFPCRYSNYHPIYLVFEIRFEDATYRRAIFKFDQDDRLVEVGLGYGPSNCR